ncbi:MAG: hypothetical protein E6H67_08150 [Betaproteobacteria bacterium]|nr:MAG: hypothetical protein E6H67_08150 [Betaproteobacteria bacterium]
MKNRLREINKEFRPALHEFIDETQVFFAQARQYPLGLTGPSIIAHPLGGMKLRQLLHCLSALGLS